MIAWLWARTVKSPNPAFSQVEVPLASTFMLSTRAGKEAYVQPRIEANGYRFTVKAGKPEDAEAAKSGTKLARGGNFGCIMSGTPMNPEYIKGEGNAGRMGRRMMAIVAEGSRGRVYLDPIAIHEESVLKAKPELRPEGSFVEDPRAFTPCIYGIKTWGDLFTDRQLVALTTFSDLVGEAMQRVRGDAIQAGLSDDALPLRDGGAGALGYAEAASTYWGMAASKLSGAQSTLCRWKTSMDQSIATFGRQALPMTWDYSEANVIGGMAGDPLASLMNMMRVLDNLPASAGGVSVQKDSQSQELSAGRVVSTDPPYYDNIGYADLSDFFYIWLRRSLRSVFPGLFATLAVPKAEELIATPYRHGGKEQAESFFLSGMTQAMKQIAVQAHAGFPLTIYYAFKQAETSGAAGTASTGWETFLAAVLDAGLAITGTWPMRTELANRMRGMESNALATSMVLVCQRRDPSAGILYVFRGWDGSQGTSSPAEPLTTA